MNEPVLDYTHGDAVRYDETTTDQFSSLGVAELHYDSPSGIYHMDCEQEWGLASHAKVIAASWLLALGTVGPSRSEAVSPLSETNTVAFGEAFIAGEYEVEQRPQRGIVETRVSREELRYIPLSIRTAELPEWRPRVTGDYGRKSRDDG